MSRSALFALVPLGLTAYVFRPVLGSYFFADDFMNLYDIANLGALEYLLTPHIGHLLWLRNALFYAFNLAFGVRAELFFGAVLLTHLLNVFLLFQLLRTVARSDLLAMFGASLWGTMRAHGEPLAWYAVYGQVVLATIWLGILWQMSADAAGGRVPARRRRSLWGLLALLGCTAFGNGLGLALALPVIVAVLFPTLRSGGLRGWPLAWLFLAVPVFYVVAHVLYVLVSGQPVPFTHEMLVFLRAVSRDAPPVGEISLATAAWLYVQAIPFLFQMLAELLGYSVALLLTGWFSASTPSTATAAPLWVVTGLLLVTTVVRAGAETRRWLLISVLLAVAIYASVAVGRAALLRTMPLQYAAAAARYHYVGTIPATLAVCLLLAALGTVVRLHRAWQAALFALWAGATVWAYHRTPTPVDQHETARRDTDAVLTELRRRIAATPPGATVYVANQNFKPSGVLIGTTMFPGWGAAFTIYFPTDTVDGRLVRFVTTDPAVFAATRRGRRSAALFVAPEQVPPPAPG